MVKLRKLFVGLITSVMVVLPIVALWQRQNIMDWWRLRDYNAPSEIEALAKHTTMTELGRKLFYVHRPELNERDEFNQNCSGFEQTIVLGCYISDRSIYIFDVTDKRLNGIEQVTAAHEMLHAAYDRLSSTERINIDKLVLSTFENMENDRLEKVVEAYRVKDESVVPNELHSILATEVRKLPTELEDYYKRYFQNRLAVVEFSERYESVFTRQQNRIKALSQQISQLEKELLAQKAIIDVREAELKAESDRLTRLRAENKIEQYNSAVPVYNTKVNSYRTLINDYNTKVGRLNDLVKQHNALAVEQKKLSDAINSHSTSIPGN